MPRVYNTVSKPSPTAHLWNCSWAPGGLALLEGVLLTVPPAAMHATCPLQDITSVHSEPLPAVPSETLIMSPFVFRVWDFANSIATAELAPMSYWKREQEDFCCPCNELAPCGRKQKTEAHFSCTQRKTLSHAQPTALT